MINSALDDNFMDPSVKIISEPGRFFSCSAFTLACKIHSIRSVEKKKDERINQIKYMYYINDGVYNNFNYVITEHKQFEPRFLKVKYRDRKNKSNYGINRKILHFAINIAVRS